MTFFNDPSDYTHFGTFYGFPVYLRDPFGDCPMVDGTNIVWDFCVSWVAPEIHRIREWLRYFASPMDYEPGGWMIHVQGELVK